MPMRIGASMVYKIGSKLPLVKPKLGTIGRTPVAALPGASVQVRVDDISEHPEFSEHRRWICKSHMTFAIQGSPTVVLPACRFGESWSTKEELIAAHGKNSALIQAGEIHCYCAVVELPADPETGRPPVLLLLSDSL
jgi:hypothetical protein